MEPTAKQQCPRCDMGVLVLRRRGYNFILGCSEYRKTKCGYTFPINNPEDILDLTMVNASGIGAVEFCPHSAFLKNQQGFKNSKMQIALAKGRQHHKNIGQDPRCYIATHIYGSEHPNTYQLRTWRDMTLMNSQFGRLLVKVYYRLSPLAIKLFGNRKLFNKTLEILLNKFVELIKKEHC